LALRAYRPWATKAMAYGPEIEELMNKGHYLYPRIGEAESLNVAIATAIFCSEIKRNSFK
jgi:TrmH family RNA methyltransferase